MWKKCYLHRNHYLQGSRVNEKKAQCLCVFCVEFRKPDSKKKLSSTPQHPTKDWPQTSSKGVFSGGLLAVSSYSKVLISSPDASPFHKARCAWHAIFTAGWWPSTMNVTSCNDVCHERGQTTGQKELLLKTCPLAGKTQKQTSSSFECSFFGAFRVSVHFTQGPSISNLGCFLKPRNLS